MFVNAIMLWLREDLLGKYVNMPISIPDVIKIEFTSSKLFERLPKKRITKLLVLLKLSIVNDAVSRWFPAQITHSFP